MFKAVILALCLVTLASAITFADQEDPILQECIKNNQAKVTACTKPVSDAMMKHLEEVRQHPTDPENLKDSTKKDICCPEWPAIDCIMDLFKESAKCVEAFKKAVQQELHSDRVVKTCGTKFARGGQGCKA